jgi:hypothetical protein
MSERVRRMIHDVAYCLAMPPSQPDAGQEDTTDVIVAECLRASKRIVSFWYAMLGP